MSNKKDFMTEIYGHEVRWWVDSDEVKALDDVSIEHIGNLLSDGYTSGELHVTYGDNYDEETYGWWTRINWKEIACGLFNATNNLIGYYNGESDGYVRKQAQSALETFSENWDLTVSEF